MNYDSVISRTVAQIPPSGIRKFFDVVASMPGALSLGVGEPDFVTPNHIRESAIRSIRSGETHYSSNWGLIELRRAINRYQEQRFGISYNPDNEIIVTVGAPEGIDLALRCVIEPGDEVLVPEPSYVSYQPVVTLSGGVAVPVPTCEEKCFKIDKETVSSLITKKTKAIILPYPNNPTGAIMTREELTEIADAIRDHDIIAISDEIYCELTYGGLTHTAFASIPGMWERTVTLNGFSKAFAMTGWRMGYLCAPKELAAMMCKIHQYTALCAPIMGQHAALAALEDGFNDDFADVTHMRKVYDQRRRIMVEGFRSMGFTVFEPLGAFYSFPNISSLGYSSEEFATRLLKSQRVVTVPGTAFGKSGEGYVRCCYATSTDLIFEALDRMQNFVNAEKSAGA